MTLIVVAANPHFVVQVSDRRLTTGSRVVSEEAGKSIHWTMPGFQFLVGYTGLAQIATKPMTRALAEILLRVGQASSFNALDAVPMITGELTQTFDNRWIRRLPRSSRRLSVLVTGLSMDAGQSGPLQAHFTNFQVWGSHDEPEASDEFHPHFTAPKLGGSWPTLIQWLGSWDTIDPGIAEGLRGLLAPGKPPRAIRDKFLDLLPEWAASSGGRVGRQANSVILRLQTEPEERYHSAHASHRAHSAMRVVSVPKLQFAVKLDIAAAHPLEAPPLTVPSPQHRARPCPCGSGLKYNKCHGR